MFLKTIASASVAALLLAVPAVAQDNNSTDPLILKKQQKQNGAEKSDKKQNQQGQASDQTGNQSNTDQQQNAQSGDQGSGDQGTADKKKKTQQTQQDQQNNDSEATGSTSKAKTEITTEKRTVIRERLVTKNVTKIDRSKINFDINVGVAVPTTIQLQPLPVEVIEVVPEYRGYDYFVLADGTIIIVDPGSHQIVFVLSA
jgi:hypothetical protein